MKWILVEDGQWIKLESARSFPVLSTTSGRPKRSLFRYYMKIDTQISNSIPSLF